MPILQAFLQESGKITKQKALPKTKPKQKRPSSSSRTKAETKEDEETEKRNLSRPGTASSVGRKVNEIFDVGGIFLSYFLTFQEKFCKFKKI